jgi:hypothetical protein
MRIIRRYVVDAALAIGILTLITTAVGITARAGSGQGCVAYICSGDDGCDTNCHCQFTVGAVGQCAGAGQ